MHVEQFEITVCRGHAALDVAEHFRQLLDRLIGQEDRRQQLHQVAERDLLTVAVYQKNQRGRDGDRLHQRLHEQLAFQRFDQGFEIFAVDLAEIGDLAFLGMIGFHDHDPGEDISILYLDEIIKQIEAMEAVGYKDCEDRLNNVIKKLRDCAAGTLPFE